MLQYSQENDSIRMQKLKTINRYTERKITMKTILVSNSSLAAVLKEALAEYTCRPTCEAFCFKHPAHMETAEKLAAYLKTCEEQNPNETYLVLADTFDSTARIETVLLLEQLGLKDRAVVYTGASLPMLLQLYDEDELAEDMDAWRKLQPLLRHAA